jgi:integrase
MDIIAWDPPLAGTDDAALPVAFDPEALRLHERAKDLRQHSRAESTRRTYQKDFEMFRRWCRGDGRDYVPLPAEPIIVVWHLTACTEGWSADGRTYRPLSVSSISRRVAAISWQHKTHGHADPCDNAGVRELVSAIGRDFGRPVQRKAAATADRIRLMLNVCPTGTLIGLRDRALLALGFAGAFRRSELVALRVEDLTEVPDGYRVMIRRSKTDQSGEGQEIVIPRGAKIRPVQAVQEWLEAASVTEGLVFRALHRGHHVKPGGLRGHDVARIVKHYAQAAGLDPAEFSGHSLRAGFATSAAESGATIFKIADQTRHKSMDVLRHYVRSVDAFRDHAGAAFL